MTTYLLLGQRGIQAPTRPDVAAGVAPAADADNGTFAATTNADERDPRIR